MVKQILKPAEIVNRVHLGDALAESEFVKRYSRSLYLMLLKRTNGDQFVANECTQDALLIALSKMRSGEIREPEQISAFLRQTAIYVSVNYYRKQNRYVALDNENVIYLRTQSNDAESEINSKQIQSILREVLSMLPISRDREILDRFFLLEQEKTEVCESMELSSDHFDRVIYRAKRRVREILRNNKPLKALLHSEILEAVDDYE